MNEIVLEVEDGMWVARHSGPASDRVEEVMGTKTIVTPFSTATDCEYVMKEIKRLNPEWNVVISIMAMMQAQA